MSRSGPSNGAIAAAVIAVAAVVIGGSVAIGIRLADDYSGDGVASGPITSISATAVDRPDRTRSRTTTTTTTTPAARRATASCDARSINADLGYPDSGSRVIDCGGGWAVMASEHSGDPYWVAFRDGRWRTVRDVSMYLRTCPDEAIAKGAPGWMARKHLDTCASRNPRTTHSRTNTRPTLQPSPRPSAAVTSRPSAPASSPMSSAIASSPTATSPTASSVTSTSSTAAPPTASSRTEASPSAKASTLKLSPGP